MILCVLPEVMKTEANMLLWRLQAESIRLQHHQGFIAFLQRIQMEKTNVGADPKTPSIKVRIMRVTTAAGVFFPSSSHQVPADFPPQPL